MSSLKFYEYPINKNNLIKLIIAGLNNDCIKTTYFIGIDHENTVKGVSKEEKE